MDRFVKRKLSSNEPQSSSKPCESNKIRRKNLQRGPCQPTQHNFPQRKIGISLRRFSSSWFKEFRRLLSHVGGPNNAHEIALKKCQGLMNQNQHIEIAISKQSEQVWELYRRSLTTSDIVNVVALETTNAIITNLGNEHFVIIVDEAHDISNKEQMAIALHYVNKSGSIVECFLGIVHVKDTTTFISIYGQGYDGASNMQGEFSSLKSLILKENPSTFYVHCFAHQLQLTLVAFAKNHVQNVVGGSCKRHDMLCEKQIVNVRKALRKGETSSRQGLNQETSLKHVVDTRWGSHYATLVYSAIVDVLEIIKDDGSNVDQRVETNGLLHLIKDFDFAFILHLMKNVLGISNELSHALQRKDQGIINVMNLASLIDFVGFYPYDFSSIDLVMLDNQLETYIIDLCRNVEFASLKLEDIVYPLVCRLLKLAMILHVATTIVERDFSAMKIMKNRLCNRMGDAWMNDCLVTYIERDVFNSVYNELIIQRFHNMKSRRGQL
ncbi:hypothetical protein JHK85_028249 [Glycine max]|nr:hypothetical protein JHK85_028249 [Glycine max]